MKHYYVELGIYSNGGCCIVGTEQQEFDALNDESAIEEALALEKEMEDFYAFVMVECLEDEEGNQIEVYRA